MSKRKSAESYATEILVSLALSVGLCWWLGKRNSAPAEPDPGPNPMWPGPGQMQPPLIPGFPI